MDLNLRVIQRVVKLALCSFFCNNSQKNKIAVYRGAEWTGYICELNFCSLKSSLFKIKCQISINFEVFMNDLIKRIQHFFEEHAFGVCTRLGEKMGIATSSIRLFFIYASFLTFGSPVIIYLGLAFIMNMRTHLRRRSTIWDYWS